MGRVRTYPPILDKEWFDALQADYLSQTDENQQNLALCRYLSKGFFWHTLFESIDGFTSYAEGNGKFTLNGEFLDFATGTTEYQYIELKKYPRLPLVELTWQKKRRFHCKVQIAYVTDHAIYVTMGNKEDYQHVGFEVLYNKLYASVGDGTTQNKVEIATITQTGTKFDLECIFTPNVSAKFYVNGNLVATLTDNLPSGTTLANVVMYLCAITAINNSRGFLISEWTFLQEP